MGTRLTPNTSLSNNRKIKGNKTGYATIREIDNGRYIIIAYFQGWEKSHAIDFREGKPYKQGKEYNTFDNAKKALKKYGVNLSPRPHVKKPLAVMDYYNGKIALHEKDIIYPKNN